MKKSLPCFSALLAIVAASIVVAQSAPVPSAVAQQVTAPAAPAEAADSSRAGDQLLAKVAAQLDRRASVFAHMNVTVGGQDQPNIGSYWQQGSGEDLKIRLELVASQEAKLLQVSNGWFLWIDRRLPTGRTVTRFNLRQLRTDPALAPPDFDKLDPGKANWAAIQPLLTAHSGGLPSLIAALRDNFSFQPSQAMQLEFKVPEGAPPKKAAVFAVVGHWKPEKLAALLVKTEDPAAPSTPVEEQAPPDAKPKKRKPLPERLPQEVLVLVGQADHFPYRIEYRHLETPTADPGDSGPPIPYQLSVHPLVVLELSDVVFDAPIATGQFDYSPGDADWVDQTASLLDRLHRERNSQVATKTTDKAALPAR